MYYYYRYIIKCLLLLIALCISLNASAQENNDIPALDPSYNINKLEDDSPIADLYFTGGIYRSTMVPTVTVDLEWSAGVQYYVIPNDKIGIEYTMRGFLAELVYYHNHGKLHRSTVISQILITNEYRLLRSGVFSLWAKNGIGYSYINASISTDEEILNTTHGMPLVFGLNFDFQLARVFSLGLGAAFTAVIALHNSRDDVAPIFIGGEITLFALFHI